MWAAIIPAAMSLIGSLMSKSGGSGGSPSSGYLGQGISAMNKAVGQGQQFLFPYQQAGAGAIAPLKQLLAQGQDPSALMRTIQSGFQQSPAQAAQESQALDATKSGLAAAGLEGSGAEVSALPQAIANTLGQQQQQYYQNYMGIRDPQMTALQNMMQQGEGAASQAGEEGIQGQSALDQMYEAMQEQSAQQAGASGGVMGMLGGGISSLFGSGGGGGGILSSLFSHGGVSNTPVTPDEPTDTPPPQGY